MNITETPTEAFTAPFPSAGFSAYGTDGRSPKVLIVDDSAVVRTTFRKYLEDSYECFEAESALEAIGMLREQAFDIVITDIIMPGLSGIELLRKIVEEHKGTPVLVVSGVDRPQRALDAVRLGAADYLIKPCDQDVLQLTVERALERSTLLKSAKQYKRDLEIRNQELVRKKEQLERLQAQIIHSEKMASIGQLAAGIAHELNNPVGFLYGNLDLLRVYLADILKLVLFYDSLPLEAQAAEQAATIKSEIAFEQTVVDLDSVLSDCRDGAERVRDIVQNLRTFSRLDEAEFKKTDLHEGIESTIRILSRYFSGGTVHLLREYGELPPIDAFAAQLNQVWTNLLVNAAQAVEKSGGTVQIKTYCSGDDAVVEIIDDGVGMTPEVIGRIFDPFFTTKAVGEGTGLGLSISFGIVERHGGRIEVESRPGEGSTFRVRLPQNADPKRASTQNPYNKEMRNYDYAV